MVVWLREPSRGVCCGVAGSFFLSSGAGVMCNDRRTSCNIIPR